jgi:hypothetical protein
MGSGPIGERSPLNCSVLVIACPKGNTATCKRCRAIHSSVETQFSGRSRLDAKSTANEEVGFRNSYSRGRGFLSQRSLFGFVSIGCQRSRGHN